MMKNIINVIESINVIVSVQNVMHFAIKNMVTTASMKSIFIEIKINNISHNLKDKKVYLYQFEMAYSLDNII